MSKLTCGENGSDASEVFARINSNDYVETMEDLMSVDENVTFSVNVKGYHTINDGGGGLFNYDSTIDKSSANGGTVIDPDETLSTQGDGVGNGCWVRQYSESINIKWFGAVGDDYTDNTTSLSNVVIAAIAADTLVFIPSGIYLIDSYDVPSGTNLLGEDKYNTSLKLRTDTGTKLLYGDGISNITIKSLKLDTRKSEFATIRTVLQFNFTNPGTNIRVEDCFIPGATSAGLVVDRTDNVVIDRNDIRDCVAGDCIRSSSGTNVNVTENNLSELSDLANDRRAIQIGSTTRFSCNNNRIDGATLTFAFDFGGSLQGTVMGNYVARTLAMVDFEGNATNITVSGNSFNGLGLDNGAAYGITVFENGSGLTVGNITISDNVISGVHHGIRIEGGREISITGNTIKDCFANGISILDGALSSKISDNITISGNMINNCSKSGASSFDGIGIKADRSVVTGNHIRGTNHRYDINSDAANTICNVGLNYAQTVNRGESVVNIQLSNQRIFEGSANPESFITANPGDLYLRSTGGAGTTFYVKESGDGNTGWVSK